MLLYNNFKMKRLLLLLAIATISVSMYGQTKLSRSLKGSWTTRDRVCIVVTPITPDSLKWSIDNYQFDITFRNFLGIFKTYKASTFYVDTLGIKTTTFLKKGNWRVNNDSSTIDIVELRMENYACNCLIDESTIITYKVVWVKDGWMTWIPQNVPWHEASNNNRTVYWTNGVNSYTNTIKPSPLPNPNIIIATK